MFRFEASDCLRNLKSIERRVLDVARAGIFTVVRVAYRSIQESTLFKDRTGELRGTVDILDTGAYSKRLIVPASYAKYVNGGTKPHPITPKKEGGFLRFVVGGRVVYAKKVDHKGTSPRPFLEHAADAGSQTMKILFEEGVERAVDYTALGPS